MGYEAALSKSWEGLGLLKSKANFTVRFLADEYSVDLSARKIISLSCNVMPKDFTAILLLHYLEQKIRGLPEVTGEWLNFRELSGVEGYAAAFRKRSLEPVIRKYGRKPEAIYSVLERLPGRKMSDADAAMEIQAFEGVPVLVKLWKQDEEFPADANMFFDRSIARIFCTEDIVVLAGFVAVAL